MNITIRNIPDEVVSEIRTLSKVERRSLNSQLLIMLESGMSEKVERPITDKSFVSKAIQVEIWKDLAGRWEDSRTSQEMITDIYQHRTPGRDVKL